MSTSAPLPSILAPMIWDPDLLPPLEMDGYLTGTLLTPELEASEWVLDLWAKTPALADDNRLAKACATALARRGAIAAELQKGWPGFHPSYGEPGQKTDHDKVRTWVRGFYKAMQLDPEYWSELVDDERTRDFIGLFVGFIDIDEAIEERDDAEEIRDEHAALIPRVLVAMRKLALMREGNDPALRQIKAHKVGRNEPCPCGSGLKFKRCCAAP